MLSDLGYILTVTECPANGLRIGRNRLHIDVLVTDHLMPAMSGCILGPH